ncbi:MAG: bifunctional hydroxymethylpyrimidine kinase/phosphomethylpyrimidine kinase [Lachnospiraceae bacterium]
MKTALTIAGSDCSGGAGIQADIKTMTVHKVYAMSVITALTAQNTTGVYGIEEVTPKFLTNQLNCIFSDIYPDAIKIGMVGNAQCIQVISEKLKKEHAKHIVLDPVMVSTSGSKLLALEAVTALKKELLPLAQVITPNIPEAEILSQMKIETKEDMISAAKEIATYYQGAVLIKGGHSLSTADDLLYLDGKAKWFFGERIANENTHGTGCTLSSAIASNLALSYNLEDSIRRAKTYISGALQANLNLGKGSGPLEHTFSI